MTLLIGTASKNHVVLTADGLSRPNPITGAGKASENVQKIFPHPNSPLAIAHHGLNILSGRDVQLRIADFFACVGNEIDTVTLEELGNRLISQMDESAKETFKDPTNKGIIGFWIAGFGHRQVRPGIFEVCWPSKVELNNLRHLTIGGDGKRFIRKYLNVPLGRFSPEKTRVEGYSTGFTIAYHDALYRKADQLQSSAGQKIFGGHKHQLIIQKSGRVWKRAPI